VPSLRKFNCQEEQTILGHPKLKVRRIRRDMIETLKLLAGRERVLQLIVFQADSKYAWAKSEI